MTFLKSSFLITFFFVNTIYAGIEMSGDEDVLATVSQKLVQIEKHLKDQRIFVAPATFSWPEFNEFQKELMFVVAHDPNGAVAKDTPLELVPSHLTQKLRTSFSRLEASVYQIGPLVRGEEWSLLKGDMEKFFKYREDFLYVPARVMIKSGHLTARLEKLKQAAEIILKPHETAKNISVRVIDPVIENLSKELNELNVSVNQLHELRKPIPVEVKTIFQEKNYFELVELALGAGIFGILCAMIYQWVFKKTSRTPVSATSTLNIQSFDYYDWLKRLESNLKAFKLNEEYLTEEHIGLKNLSMELREARQALHHADNQHDYDVSLEQLNQAAPRLEEYFEKMNVRKNTELSRRMVNLVVQLCDALESRQEIVFTENKAKKDFKIEAQVVELNVA